MPNWTKEQLDAILARNHTILVSAAAGSGKTAVLVERIVMLLREGARLDRMMIVTFTRAAAAEMRQRLNVRLQQEVQRQPELMTRALDALENTEISTIHSFCQHLLREEFQAAGIDPLSTICEEQKRDTLFHEAYVQAFDELMDAADTQLQHLADATTPEMLESWVKQLHTFLTAIPHPFDWLEQHTSHLADEPFEAQAWYHVIEKYAAQQAEGMGMILEKERTMLEEPYAVQERMEDYLEDLNEYRQFQAAEKEEEGKLYSLLKGYSFKKMKTVRGLKEAEAAVQEWDKAYKKLRTEHKDLVKELLNLLAPDEERWRMELGQVQQETQALATLCRRTADLFQQSKREKNLLDFSDLEQMTVALLDDKDQRDKLQKRFDHIFVDECQDVSAVQDAIIQQLQGENTCLFMVGDVKQSIYRFRQADPTLFLHRMRTFSDEEDAKERRIFLQKNFRSRGAVLEATNRVFRKVMRAEVTELDYLPEDELICGRMTENDPPVEIALVEMEKEKIRAGDQITAQAMEIAERICAMTHETFFDGEKERAYTFRDMVILLPAVSGVGEQVAQVLESRGVPVYFDGAANYFELPEIRAVTELLRVIDNDRQDLPLLAALKMSPFLFTDQELAEVRKTLLTKESYFYEAFLACAGEETAIGLRCRAVRDKLDEWRFLARTLPLTDFLWQLLRETGMLAISGALPEGELRQANLVLMCQRAAEYEDGGGTSLNGFLQVIGEMRAAGDNRSAKVLGENENLVRIMTIHKSKGLEFPVVLVMGLDRAMHRAEGKSLRLHSHLGVCLPYMRPEFNIRRATLLETAFDLRRKLDEKAERARLLYVAMTRARERLVLVMDGQEDAVWTLPESNYRVWNARCMADWVMQCVMDDKKEKAISTGYQQPANPWKIKHSTLKDPQAVENNQTFHNVQEWVSAVLSVPAGEKLGKEWLAGAQKEEAMPLKTSVSAVVRQRTLHDPMPIMEEEEDMAEKAGAEEITAPLTLSELPQRPLFLEQHAMTGAESGTLHHRVLSLMDLRALRDATSLPETVQKELDRMEAQGLLTAGERAIIRPNLLLMFYRSEMGQRQLHSPEVRREWRFNLRMREQGDTLLQGVIDCAFREEEHWVLLDYKTDHVQDEEAFAERYRLQLALYRQAVEQITNEAVGETWLYALRLGKAIRLN